MDSIADAPGLALTPASYGSACVNCSKAKCRCLTRAGKQSCERCIRLSKECISLVSTRKRAKNPSRLEEKVDGILELLKSGGVLDNVKGADGLVSRPTENGMRIVDHGENVENAVLSTSASPFTALNPHPVYPTSTPSSFSEISGQTSSSSISGSATEEADCLLERFQSQILPGFPFIHILSSTTAQELQQQRPFLLLAIMTVSSKAGRQKQAFGDEIKQKIAQEVLSDKEGNLDVLLGLLVFLAWGHDQLVHTQLASRFTQLAMSMLFDLRLNKAPSKGASAVFNLCPLTGNKEPKNRTLEERRVALGCYFMSSTVAWYFGKIDSLRWTPYMNECLRILDTEWNAPSDEMLVVQVKLQLIAEQVTDFAASNNTDPSGTDTSKGTLPFYLRALHSQLSDIQRNLSPEAEQNSTVRASIHHTSISINALALPSPSSHLSPLASNPNPNLEPLTACVLSLKAWFALFLTIPSSRYPTIAFPFFTQLAHAVVVLHRLSVLEMPGWDRGAVRETVDVLGVLECVVGRFRGLSMEAEGGNDGKDIFRKLAWVFDSVRIWSRGKLVLIFGEDGVDRETGAFGGEVGLQEGFGEVGDVGVDVGVDLMMANGMDDVWLSEMLGPWSYDFL